MKKLIKFTLNGDTVETLADTRQTLLDLLRDTFFLTGTKEGCSNGNCGSCTVHLDGLAVDSCLVFAMEVNGREVLTIEGITKPGRLNPLQKAFIEVGGLECGFCTPGVIMSAVKLLEDNPKPNEEEIRTAIAGNLCRCTGYDKIVRSIQTAAKQMSHGKSRN